MGNSFQDQLLKAGLVDKKQAKKAKRENYVAKKKKGKKAAPKQISEARKEQLADEQRVRELNLQRSEEKKQQEKIAQVRQLIETNRLKLDPRDNNEPYHFVMGKRIKKMYVSEKIITQLSKGLLAIVTLDDEFQLVPAKAALQIAERDAQSIVVFYETPENDEPL